MFRILPVLLLLIALPAQAKQLVLIQGYLADASSWDEAGITRVLRQNNWAFGGLFHPSVNGAALRKTMPGMDADNYYYLVSLPTEAPVHIQARYLKSYLDKLRTEFPDDELILAGHSAGGVVARYLMVTAPQIIVDRLITIASPHLGTSSASIGATVAESPLSLLTPMIGAGAINRSESLYRDLQPEQPNRFLYWLNRQPHPQAEYISIVRDNKNLTSGDLIVEENSQHLEHVYNLRYRAQSFVVPANHSLVAADGFLLLDLIEDRFLKPL